VEVAEAWVKLVLSALEQRTSGQRVVFRAEAGAREVFRQWHNECVSWRNGEAREHEAKLMRGRENAIRIALVFAAADWLATKGSGDEAVLSAEHAARGVAWARYFTQQTLTLTHSAAMERRAARLEELLKILDQNSGRMTLRRLRDNHGFGETELNQIVGRSLALLRIETRTACERGGRPSRVLVKSSDTPPAKTAKP
jgi:hypothetical protein